MTGEPVFLVMVDLHADSPFPEAVFSTRAKAEAFAAECGDAEVWERVVDAPPEKGPRTPEHGDI